MNKEAWRVLREKNPRYAFPENPEEYEKTLDEQNRILAKNISDNLHKRNISSVASFGCGTGVFEYLLLQYSPKLRLLCSENIKEHIQAIERFVPCYEVREIDLLASQLPSPQEFEIGILKRIDTEFTAVEMWSLFGRFSKAGYDQMIFITSSVLTLQLFYKKILWYLSRKLAKFLGKNRGDNIIFTGYSRTRALLQSFWEKCYTVEDQILVEGHWVVWLKRREREGRTGGI